MNAPDKAPVIRSRDWSGRALALISLAVALAGFSYNTWRNETTEAHRNVRQASFQMLNEIGQLQQIVDNRYYANDHSEMTRIAGWGKAALLRDLGPLVSPTTAQRSQERLRCLVGRCRWHRCARRRIGKACQRLTQAPAQTGAR